MFKHPVLPTETEYMYSTTCHEPQAMHVIWPVRSARNKSLRYKMNVLKIRTHVSHRITFNDKQVSDLRKRV